MPRVIPLPIFQHQADATLSETNPVSTTLYTVLDTTKNVRVIQILAKVTWGTNQPTLDIVITIDGNTIVHSVALPVSGTNYFTLVDSSAAEATQPLSTADRASESRPFLIEGRSVKVQIRYTGAAGTTNVTSRVKYAKIP